MYKTGGVIQPKHSGSRVAILDAGAQYGKVIDRRVRQLKIYSELLPLDTPFDQIADYDAFIISGGPESVYDVEAPKPDPTLWDSGKPILGICYGMQLINQAYGGAVQRKQLREDGQVAITVETASPLFAELKARQHVLMSHGDSLGKVARGFDIIANSGEIIAALGNDERRIYGVQFHPEVDLTESGQQMLSNFLLGIAKLTADFNMQDRLEEALDYIRNTVGDRHVLAFASGGVDSTVCAVLLGKALPAEQVTVVHIDTGFMRHNESELVEQALGDAGIKLQVVSAADQFFNATTTIAGQRTPPLREVADPEIKRAIIGDCFMAVMDDVVNQLQLDPSTTVLAQGTLRPDLIESASELASSKAAVIKTHHNDTALVRRLRKTGRVIEPLQQLHKDEVRQLGEKLGIPAELVWRQPFPGPGLAIRLLCAAEPYMTEQFDTINNQLQEFADKDTAAQLLPVRTVGVQGDGRSYNYLAALSGTTTDWPQLVQTAREIPKALHDINRVVYVFGDKLTEPVRDITPTLPTPEAVEQLRQADWEVDKILREYDLVHKLSQVPVISFPVHFGKPGCRSIGIRAFITNDFMTGRPAVPGEDFPLEALEKMVKKLTSISGISRVVYDITAKPPGTTEWE